MFRYFCDVRVFFKDGDVIVVIRDVNYYVYRAESVATMLNFFCHHLNSFSNGNNRIYSILCNVYLETHLLRPFEIYEGRILDADRKCGRVFCYGRRNFESRIIANQG